MINYYSSTTFPDSFQRIILINFRDVAPYDIALLKLASPLKWTSMVRPIMLPSVPSSTPTGNATLTGWGSISKTSNPIMPTKLQTVDLPLINLVTCRRAIEKLTGPSPLHETNICTGPLTGGFSACSVSISCNLGDIFP